MDFRRRKDKYMKSSQIINDCLTRWKNISGLDFCLLDEDDTPVVNTGNIINGLDEKVQALKESEAPSLVLSDCLLYKVTQNQAENCTLILYGSGAVLSSTIGELCVCQVESLLAAYAEKNDKNIFIHNLLLGRYTPAEVQSRAKKLHLSWNSKRAVMLVETRQQKDESVLTTIRNLFAGRSRDIVTALEDGSILILSDLSSGETPGQLKEKAAMLVDLLNTEAMTSAWVSLGGIAEDLSVLPNAFKEARTAMEIGKIFFAQKNVFSYENLGIGRLIYQLPTDICEMFLREIFKGESPEDLDEETLNTVRTLFENNLNLAETSRQLYVHRNTLVYRFEKLQKKFGLDVRTFEDALTFKLALMVSDYVKAVK